MSMGFVAAGVAVGGAVLSYKAQKDAAKTSAKASDNANQMQWDMYQQTEGNLAPFMNAGTAGLPMLMESMKPIDREQALSDYYSGGEYAMMSGQANNNLMANAEAMGGMGGSANANNLMRIAPQMGMQHLGSLEAQQMDQYNRAMGLVNMGQNAANQTGAAGQQYASQAGNNMMNAANVNAQSQMAQANTLSNAMGNLAGIGYQAYNGGF